MVHMCTKGPQRDKRETKQQSECCRREASEGSNAIERYFQIYKAIPGCVSFFWTHQEGLPRAENPPNSIRIEICHSTSFAVAKGIKNSKNISNIYSFLKTEGE